MEDIGNEGVLARLTHLYGTLGQDDGVHAESPFVSKRCPDLRCRFSRSRHLTGIARNQEQVEIALSQFLPPGDAPKHKCLSTSTGHQVADSSENLREDLPFLLEQRDEEVPDEEVCPIKLEELSLPRPLPAHQPQLLQPAECHGAGLVIDPRQPRRLSAAHPLRRIQESSEDGQVAGDGKHLVKRSAKCSRSGSHGWLV